MKSIFFVLIFCFVSLPYSFAGYGGEVIEGVEIPDGDFDGDALHDGQPHKTVFGEDGDIRDPFLDEDHHFGDDVQEATQKPREFVDHAKSIAEAEDRDILLREGGDRKGAEISKKAIKEKFNKDPVQDEDLADVIQSWAKPGMETGPGAYGENEGSSSFTGSNAPKPESPDPAPTPDDFTPTNPEDLGDGDAIL